MVNRFLFLIGLLVPWAGIPAQSSASYRLEEHAFNAGGRPEHGTVATSGSYSVTLDSIGDALVDRGLSSASYSMDGSFAPVYGPPGEVLGLHWTSGVDLEWDARPLADTYNVYRDSLGDLPGTHGECLAPGLESTNHADSGEPAAGSGFFYLVTARNRLAEEGSRGVQSDGTPRSTLNACP